MSAPEGTGPRWPLRPAGFVLLGFAVAAALIGLMLVATDDTPTTTDGESPTTTGERPDAETAPPSVIATPPTTSPTTSPAPTSSVPATAAPTPAPAGPGAAAPVPAEADSDTAGSGKGDSRTVTRVYNNSTIRGLAARAAEDLTAAGWTVAEVGNYSGGRIPTTTVYYREGTDERASAEAIGAEFGMRVMPRFPGIADTPPGVIVIVTNDYGT